MHRSEIQEMRTCADCGAELSPARDRGYVYGESNFLCFDCAVRRGGSWDEAHDHWAVEADVGDLGTSEE